MTTQRFATCLVMVLLTVAGAAAQRGDYQDDSRPRREVPPAGFFPTERMIDLAINRITDEMAVQYGFDEDQLWQTRELIKDRFPTWMQENRGELQTLMNEYVEALIGDDPPDPTYVADWAQRALPLFGEFREMVYEVSDDMRGYLTEEQQIILDGELAAVDVAMNYTRARFQLWGEGGYDPETEWPRSRKFQEQERERQRQLEREVEEAKVLAMGGDPATVQPAEGGAAAAGAEPTKEAETKRTEGASIVERTTDEWEQYVENFIKRYNLDEAQENSARKALRQAQGTRDRYLRQRLDDIKRLEVEIQSAATDEERDRQRERYEQLTAPLDRYFQQLKDKLARLPNREQRRQAAFAEIQARAASEAQEKPAAPPREE